MIVMMIFLLYKLQNQSEILVLVSLHICLQRDLPCLQMDTTSPHCRGQGLEKHILLMKFGIKMKVIGWYEKVFVIKFIKKQEQQMNLLMHPVASFQGKGRIINSKCVSNERTVIWIWMWQLLLTWYILRMF